MFRSGGGVKRYNIIEENVMRGVNFAEKKKEKQDA